LLGYREDLSPAVIQSFADSGTVHVICVAGLHVGIIYLLLNFLLGFLTKVKGGDKMRTLLLLLLLWAYALLTGLATPVLRATIMFSFILIGKYLNKRSYSINSLCCSAFLLLLINPFNLADTGFQLSYLAVAGILIIYPFISSLWEITNPVINKIWELLILSFSAQLSIAPLSLLYFHQLPNYFLFTNLLVVPLLSIVVCAGLFFLFTAYIPFLCLAGQWMFQKSCFMLNWLVKSFSGLPFFVSKGISITPFEAALIYLIMISLFLFLTNKKYSYLLTGLSACLLFLGLCVVNAVKNARLHEIAIYDVPEHSAITFLSSKKGVMPFSNIDSANISMHLQYHYWAKGVDAVKQINNDTNAALLAGQLLLYRNFAQFRKTRFAFIRSNNDINSITGQVHLNYIALSGAFHNDISNLKTHFCADTIIFDSSVPSYRLTKWKKECEMLNQAYYDVKEKGALVIRIL
jgi:competence protein ComEC